jgi:hypothetical protein
MTDRESEGSRIPGFKGNAFGVKASILDGLVKNPSALQLRRCSVRVSTLHSSVFARLASGAFYETIVLLTFTRLSTLDSFGVPAEADIPEGKIKSGVNHCG